MDTEKKTIRNLIKRYIRMKPSIWAENSYCQRHKVGALIGKDKNDYSTDNGTPSGSGECM